jgi:hypothetical protein
MLFQGRLFTVFGLIQTATALPYPSDAQAAIPISHNALRLSRQIPRPQILKERLFEGKVGGFNVSMDGTPLLTA